jgi:PhnB protein
MNIHPYLGFNGDCENAFEFYEKVLGGKIVFRMTWGEMPEADRFPSEMHKRIMHATLNIGDAVLMGADSPPGQFEKPTGMHVSIHLNDVVEGERIFNALAENGNVTMPFQKTFWSPGFGMCMDRFGTPWMINTEGQPPD